MIDGTEEPKIPSKFAKHTQRDTTNLAINILAVNKNKESQKTVFRYYQHFLSFSLERFLIMVFFKKGPSGVKIIIANY